ncbi:MAG: dipeptidase [Acidimicrobiales bacterium]
MIGSSLAPPVASGPVPRSGPRAAHAYARRHGDRFVEELKTFVSIPSVSADPPSASHVSSAAEWLASHLQSIGMNRVEVAATRRHPIVYADWVHRRGRPTVLIYGHYDVQPADPLSSWQTPPFRPTIVGNDLRGRGASDDKGQLWMHVKALESWLKGAGSLPVNVRCVFEGEEEIGSPNLRLWLEHRRHGLRSDVAVISDFRMLGPNRPALTYSLRGAFGFEVVVRGPARADLHSGSFGGIVEEPARVLAEIIATLRSPGCGGGVAALDANVRELGPAERRFMARNGPSNTEILASGQIRRPYCQPGYSLYETTTIRPALTVNGITAGYQGAGSKAVIPAAASAKFNARLVPDQDPNEVEAALRRFVTEVAARHPGSRVTLRTLLKARPAVVDRRHPAMRAAARAYRTGFGVAPRLLRSGGTVPVVTDLQDLLALPVVMMGFALPDDRMHAPNERLHLPTFHRGVATSIAFLSEIARSQRP